MPFTGNIMSWNKTYICTLYRFFDDYMVQIVWIIILSHGSNGPT